MNYHGVRFSQLISSMDQQSLDRRMHITQTLQFRLPSGQQDGNNIWHQSNVLDEGRDSHEKIIVRGAHVKGSHNQHRLDQSGHKRTLSYKLDPQSLVKGSLKILTSSNGGGFQKLINDNESGTEKIEFLAGQTNLESSFQLSHRVFQMNKSMLLEDDDDNNEEDAVNIFKTSSDPNAAINRADNDRINLQESGTDLNLKLTTNQ